MRYSSKLLSLLRGIEHLLSQPGTNLEQKKNTYFFNLNGAICDNNTYTHMHTHINALSLFLTLTVFFMAASCLDDFKATNKTWGSQQFQIFLAFHIMGHLENLWVHVCICIYIYLYMCEIVGIYLCMWVGSHVCMRVYTCVCTCRGQRSPSDVILQSPLPLFFLRQCLSLDLDLPDQTRLLSREPQGSAYLYIPSVGITGTCHHAWLLYVGTMYQVLVFAQPALKLSPTPLATVRWMWDSLDCQTRKQAKQIFPGQKHNRFVTSRAQIVA